MPTIITQNYWTPPELLQILRPTSTEDPLLAIGFLQASEVGSSIAELDKKRRKKFNEVLEGYIAANGNTYASVETRWGPYATTFFYPTNVQPLQGDQTNPIPDPPPTLVNDLLKTLRQVEYDSTRQTTELRFSSSKNRIKQRISFLCLTKRSDGRVVRTSSVSKWVTVDVYHQDDQGTVFCSLFCPGHPNQTITSMVPPADSSLCNGTLSDHYVGRFNAAAKRYCQSENISFREMRERAAKIIGDP